MRTQQFVMLFDTYSPKKTYSEKEIAQCLTAWTILQDEIFLLEDNHNLKTLVKKSIDKLLLIEKIRLIENWGNLLAWYGNTRDLYVLENRLEDYDLDLQGIYAAIKKQFPKIAIQYFQPIEVNLKLIERVALSYINEYNTKHKDIKQKVEKIEKSIYYEVHNVNIITGLKLDANTMVCAEWIEAKKIAKEINLRNSKPTTNGV